MTTLIKSGATLLLLTAFVGLAGGVAAQVVEEARTALDEQWAGLNDLQARWAELGVPAEVTAPVAAIPDVADQTLALPGELTETATDILSQGTVTDTLTLTGTEALSTTGETSTPVETSITAETTTGDLIAASSKVVALGALEKDDDPPAFLIEKAGRWRAEGGFYVRVRFIDGEGRETAFCTHFLDAAGDRTWRLDLSEVAALPDGWRGTGLVTVHDGLRDGAYELSEEHEIRVHTGSP